jgi:hypothetical protein
VTPLFQLDAETGAGLLSPGYQAQGNPFRPVRSGGKVEGGLFFGGNFLAGKKITPALKQTGEVKCVEGK